MSKKSESIEIRLSPELKSALSRVSSGRGTSMSDTVRNLIEGEVAGRGPVPPTAQRDTVMPLPLRSRGFRALAAALPLATLAAIYVVSSQSTATATSEIRAFFAQVDADADHSITQPEVEAFLAAGPWPPQTACADLPAPCTPATFAAFQVARADIDGSGAVSYDEFAAVNLRDWAEDFLAMDGDGNGAVTVDEVLRFDLPRADGGTLSPDCRAALEAAEAMLEVCEISVQARADAEATIASYDADHSGAVTLEEYIRP